MTGPGHQPFELGDWLVEPEFGRISRGHGRVPVQPKAMKLLVYLAGEKGHVVSTDDILDHLWGEVIVASGSVYFWISQLREALGDDSHHPSYIETIAKRGYRLIAEVRFVEAQNGGRNDSQPIPRIPWHGRKRALSLIGVLALVILVAIQQHLNVTRTSGSPPPERSIAVLPFADLSPEGDQEYFADGIAEELLNALAKVPRLRVTGRTSSFTFRDGNQDPRVIGEVLGVAHILEGSVRRSGARVRVTVKLVDASDGFHVWSTTYDREMKDIFAVQDDITANVVTALKKRLGIEVGAPPRVMAAANAQAYNAYLLGVYQMEKRNAGALSKAVAHFERAIEIDPDYAPALSRLGMTYLMLAVYEKVDYPLSATCRKALLLIDRALALAPDLPEGHAAKGLFHFEQGDFAAAERDIRHAIRLNPNYAIAYSWLGSVMGRTLRFDEELAYYQKSVQADPLSPLTVSSLIDAYIDRNMTEEARALLPGLQQLSPIFHERESYFLARRQGRLAAAAVNSLNILSIGPSNFFGLITFSDALTNAFGLYRDDIRLGYRPAGAHIALGETEQALAIVRKQVARDPDNVGTLTFAGRVYAAAGRRRVAREALERAWQSIPDGPGKESAFMAEAQLALIALRLDAGDSVVAKALIGSLREAVDKLEAAGVAGTDIRGGYRWANGMLYLFERREEEGRASLARALKKNYIPSTLDLHLLDRFPGVDAPALLAGTRQRMAIERDKFLAIVCNGGNPAPEVWMPLPETCDGHVEG